MTKEIYLTRNEVKRFREEGWGVVIKAVYAADTEHAMFRADITLPDDQHARMLSMLDPLGEEEV